jgi:hypothetical protein
MFAFGLKAAFRKGPVTSVSYRPDAIVMVRESEEAVPTTISYANIQRYWRAMRLENTRHSMVPNGFVPFGVVGGTGILAMVKELKEGAPADTTSTSQDENAARAFKLAREHSQGRESGYYFLLDLGSTVEVVPVRDQARVGQLLLERTGKSMEPAPSLRAVLRNDAE